MAQQPFISSIDKATGTATEVVVITGSDFTSTQGEVYFGVGKATNVVDWTDDQIKVEVPASATKGPVTIVRSDGLSATSGQFFNMAFDVDSKTADFSNRDPAELENDGKEFVYDLCLCDFDGDDLLDAVVTNNDETDLTLVLNQSTASSNSYSLSVQNNDNTSHNIECADLNNDGMPDLVVSSSASGEPFIHIYENTSSVGSLSFSKEHKITLPQFNGNSRLLKNVRISDADGDGMKDVIVGNFLAGDNNLFVYLNTSGGSVSVNTTPQVITVPDAQGTGAFDMADFNKDGKEDIALIPHRQSSSSIYILRNRSIPGSVSYELVNTLGSSAERVRLVTADFDNDGMVDFAVTRSSFGIEVFKNNGDFDFSEAASVSSGGIQPWGIDAGDMNGDGEVDLVAGSIAGGLLYYSNDTNGGSIAFSLAEQITTDLDEVRNVRIGDLNRDGKPDIAFTNNSQANAVGEFGTIINRNCMTPVIKPLSGDYCDGTNFILAATKGQGVTYNWTVSGGTSDTQNTGVSNELNIGQLYTTDVTVSVTATGPGSCTESSGSSGSYDNQGSATLSPPTIDDIDASGASDSGIICEGSALSLSTSASSGSCVTDCYEWTGPNGFSTITDANSVTISSNAQSTDAGTYSLIVFDGTCASPAGTYDVIVSSPPATSINVASCDDGNITLEVPDYSGQFTYDWQIDGASQGAGTSSSGAITFNAASAGSYTVSLENANGCVFTSDPVIIRGASNAGFSGPDFEATNEPCINVPVTFTANDDTPDHNWEIYDPSDNLVTTSSESNIEQTFTETGNWTVRLSTTYPDGAGCFEKTITVSDEPSYAVNVSAPGTTKCPSETVTLSLTETDIVSYSWDDTDGTSGPLEVTEPGTYTATYITDTGCELTAQETIENLPGLGLNATDATIENDTIQLAEGQFSVGLEIAGNATDISWTKDGVTEDGETANTYTLEADNPITVVSVTATTSDGCTETEQVVVVSGSFTPRQSFSPNGDGLNDCWEILNSSFLQECTVYVLDPRGRVIFQGETPFEDDCVWDGSANGTQVPEGVYYFVMKCSEGEENQSGSILLAR